MSESMAAGELHVSEAEQLSQKTTQASLAFLFFTFLRIGSLAFGGYMALISVIENIMVKRHRLISHQDMLDGISLANLLPGPMAVNVVAYTGYRIRGRAGALVAATAVILPSFLLILGLSYFYFNYGHVFNMAPVFQGFMPAVAAIVFSVAWRLGRKTITGMPEFFLALLAIAVLFAVPLAYKIYAPVSLIIFSGLLGFFLWNEKQENATRTNKIERMSWLHRILLGTLFISMILLWFYPLPLDKNSVLFLTLTFASMSLMLFGGGYVFIPIIGSIVVLENGWLSAQQFADGIALGQVTPGPILISATFIGYKVAGFWGALFSTIGIFAVPAILMVVVSRSFVSIRESLTVKAVMHGIHSAVIGMIIVAALIIFKSSIPSWSLNELSAYWPLFMIFVLSMIGLLRFNLDVVWIIPPAGFIGYLFL